PRLRGWLQDDATGRQLRTHLTQTATQWADRGRDPGELYRGARLSAALDWARDHDPDLNVLERDFLEQSRLVSDRETERQRRTNRRLRGLLVGTAVFLVVALVAGALAFVQRSRARDAQAAAEAQALRSDAERLGTLAVTEPNLDRALLLAVAGVNLRDLPETRGDLLGVLQNTPALIGMTRPSRSQLVALGVSPDGRLMATADSAGVVYFNDVGTWRPNGAAVRLEGAVTQNALAFSPDGGRVAVATATAGDTSNLYLVDVSARTATRVGSWRSIPAVAGPLRFTRMAFSPDGARIAVAVASAAPDSPVPVSQRLLLLGIPDGRVVWDRPYPLVPGQNETSVAFGPDGVLITSAQQGETLLWDARRGRVTRRFPIGGPFAVSPDGRQLALAENNPDPSQPESSMALLDLRTGKHRSLEPLPVPGWIVSVEFAGGRTILGRSFDAVTRAWDPASGAIVDSYAGHASGLIIAVTPDGRTLLSGGEDGSVAAWDLSGSQRLGRTFRWRTPQLSCPTTPCFVINPRGTVMAESLADGTVALVDLRRLRVAATLPARNGSVADALAFSPDGAHLATGGITGTVTLWHVSSRSVVRTLRFSDRVWRVAFSPDGKLLAVQTKAPDSSSSRVAVHDLASRRQLYAHEVPFGKGDLEFSPDGRRLTALGCCEPDSAIAVWAARSGSELFLPKVAGHATTIAFSSDGDVLAAGAEDGKVLLFDAHDGSPAGPPIQVATGTVDPLSFSPDGRLFAASSSDLTATIWDLRSRTRLGNPFPIEQGSIPVARFAPNGVLVIDNLSSTSLWPSDLRTWVRFACHVAGRDLSRTEWTELLGERPYRSVCPR
ncbi:MAG: WD40 repeat domain-containing protein, partial [Actinomycetota bacterium]